MKNFRGSALAAGVGTPESAPHELLGSSLHFYLRFKHRNFFIVSRCEDNQNYCKNMAVKECVASFSKTFNQLEDSPHSSGVGSS